MVSTPMTRPAMEEKPMEQERKYIELVEAAKEVGIARTTIYTYIEALRIKTKKFPKDRSTYLSMADFRRIRDVRLAAKNKRH